MAFQLKCSTVASQRKKSITSSNQEKLETIKQKYKEHSEQPPGNCKPSLILRRSLNAGLWKGIVLILFSRLELGV